ncbi:MAG: dynamin family protein [Planctomycetes bacterium]|nr:dynamin family protein [Planctomycetota bacterium]
MTAVLNPAFKNLEKYYRDLHAFGIRLAEVALKFQQSSRAGKFPERGAAFVYDRNDPREILNRSIDITREFEFLVAVTGAFSSGKSTLLNVLLNFPDLLPVSAIPLTAVCTVIRFGETPRIKVRYVSYEESFNRVRLYIEKPFKKEFIRPDQLQEAMERPENFVEAAVDQTALKRFARLISNYERMANRSVNFDQRYPYCAGGGLIPVPTESGMRYRYFLPTPGQEEQYLAGGGDPDLWITREWLAFIRDVTLWVDAPLLHNNIVFLDLPGLNCREDYHRRAIREYCNMADCIVVTAFQPGNQADEEVIQNFKGLSSNFREKLFFVFNRVDQFQMEPEELSRSFDYLTRDCIGQDFPKSRCFLTSAYLARENAASSQKFYDDFERYKKAFQDFKSSIAGLDKLVGHTLTPQDPGGVKYFRDCLQTFLTEDAYRTKIKEILQNYETVVENLHSAASPRYEDVLRADPRELLMRAAFDYFHKIEQLARRSIYGFRYEYLHGSEDGHAILSRDLKGALERAHGEIQRRIISYFNQPVQTAPPREDPVRDFDLRRIADDASNLLRLEFQEIIASTVVDCVRQRFYECLNRYKLREHLKNLLNGSPEWVERIDRMLERFELMLRHSVLCKIRNRFYSMPGGRDLKRLEQTIRIVVMKELLVKVFSDFYPNWIFQNIYSEIQDGLWLSFFLDAEELETELRKFFDSIQGVVTTSQVLDKVKIPEELAEGFGDLYEISGLCKQIEGLIREMDSLRARNSRLASSVTQD